MKLKPIMLETTDNSRICYLSQKGKERNDLRLLEIECPIILDSINYHFYLIDTDAEIEECDYVYEDGRNRTLNYDSGLYNVVKKCENSDFKLIHINTGCTIFVRRDFNKIIASTDSLENIPNISEQSINQLVDYYNKNGKMPEFVEIINKWSPPQIPTQDLSQLEDNNQVDITIPEDEIIGKPLENYIKEKHSQDRCMGFIDGWNAHKNSIPEVYIREEVCNLLNKYRVYTWKEGSTAIDLEKFIKQNL